MPTVMPHTSEVPALLNALQQSEQITLLPIRKINSSFISARWKHRLHRRVYLLSDGTHTEQDIARLLNKPLGVIRGSLGLLFSFHLIDVRLLRRKDTTLLNPMLLSASLDYMKPEERQKEFTDIFYSRLRVHSMRIDNLFASRGTNMEHQGKKLFKTLKAVVTAVQTNDPELPMIIKELGNRHVTYGVQPWMYAVVGQSLLEAFEEFLGPAWTPDMRDSWSSAYTLISSIINKDEEEL